MPKNFEFPITDTVNDMVACDQIRFEIENEVDITATLLSDPNGVVCTKDRVFFNFDADLSVAGESALAAIVAAHTGQGLPSPNEMDALPVADLPYGLTVGATFYAADGNEGPGPVWYDGTDWRWYVSGGIVSP